MCTFRFNPMKKLQDSHPNPALYGARMSESPLPESEGFCAADIRITVSHQFKCFETTACFWAKQNRRARSACAGCGGSGWVHGGLRCA
jgi:hypothetical protein